MILDKHWWRTRDGRLVPDGDPGAATLAYPRGHEVPDHLARQIGLLQAVEAEQRPSGQPEPEAGAEAQADEDADVDVEKQAEQPADKMVRKGADKAAKRPPASGPGSSVDAWREYAAKVTGEPVEAFAGMSRDEIMQLLDA